MSSWDSDYRYEPPSLFEQVFRCLPFDQHKNPELETGNKIIMPQSALSLLLSLPVSYPLFFKMESFTSDKISHCGVLEFSSEEGFVYMPRWMMANLSIDDGGEVILRDASPSRGMYMKLQPHATAFVELSNPKAVLETALRGFACLNCGDTIMVRYNGKEFFIDVLEVRPGGEVISLIETDCVLDFAPPLDYCEEVEREGGGDDRMEEREEEGEGVREFRPFVGVGMRLDGNVGGGSSAAAEEGKKREEDGGKLGLNVKKVGEERGEVREFRPFAGVARRLDGTVGSGGAEGAPAVAAEEGKKREKDEEREKFKAFSGRGRVLGGPFFD